MKLALVLLLATAGTLRVHSVPINDQPSELSGGLEKDLNDFLALVPIQKIEEIFLEYLANDADFHETLQYLVSEDFTSLILDGEALQEVKNFLKYLYDAGLDVYSLLNRLHDFLGLEHYVPLQKQFSTRITGGLPGLITDIEAVLPHEKIAALYQEKLQTSQDFVNLLKRLQSSEFQNIRDAVCKNPKYQDLKNKAKAKGVDVKAIIDLSTKIIGIQLPKVGRSTTMGMQEDIDDFLALVPTQKIQDLVLEYLATDPDFQATMDYILSDEFRSLILDVEAIPEVRMFIKYLHNAGLDVYNGLKILHDFLGIEHYVPFTHNYGLMKITGGLPGLVQDIKDMLPVHEIQELYEYKLKTSEAFRSLVQQLKSEESQKIIDIVWANEKFIKLLNRAEAKGVDVKGILQLLTDILGIKFPSLRTATMGLNEDLQEFLALVPQKEIEDLVMEYLTSDADFQEAVEYMLSDDFKKLILDVEAIQDVKMFIKYLNDAGLDVYTLLNTIHDFLGLDHLKPSFYENYKISGGLPGLIEDVKAILPLDKIEALYKKKLETSPEFAALIKRLGSPEFQKIVDTVWANPKLQELISRAQAKGVDVKAILKLITEILGIHFPSGRYFSETMGLNEDLQEFLALVPQKEIENLVMEYLTSDADFQEAVEYMLSDDFKKLILDIEAIQDVKVFIKYLNDAGLDVYTLLNTIHDFLGLDHLKPSFYENYKISGGLPGLIEDVKAILPLDKIEALYKKKLETSPEFAALIKRLGSQEFQKIVDTVWANPKLQELISRAQAKGVDVKAILKLITEILGIHFPSGRLLSSTMGLNKDLEDFLKLVPMKQIEDLVMEYLTSDADFQEAVEYMLSDDFKKLVLEIESIKDVKLFIKYLNDAGLDVYTVLNKLHDFLGLDHITPLEMYLGNLKYYRISGGLPGLIEDVKAILPLDKIEALYKQKLETSPEFAALIKRLGSQEFQKIVDTVWANPKLQELISRAQAKGVDVKAILKLITEILGIHFPSGRLLSSTMGLNKDLEDFLKLVPMKQIEDLVMEYLTSDADFQEAVEYMLSDDFKKLVLEIESIKDVKLFIKYLNDAGLDVYTVLNKLHDFLGLDHITPLEMYLGNLKYYRISGGLPGLIEDVKAILPLDKIEALYKQKLETSPEFAALIKRLGAPEFQKIVDTVWANPKLQELISRAQAKGVDVKAILKLITEILGIHFPSGRLLSSTMGLNKDLEDFLKLVPMKQIEDLVMEYLTSDADFQEAVEYMLSDDFKKLVLDIEAIKDVKLFIKYLNDAGLDVYTVLNKLHDFLGLDHITPLEMYSGNIKDYRISGGLPGLIEDVKAILPLDKIEALYKQKLETSPEFAALIKRLGSPEFQRIVDTVWANPKLQELISKAQSKGVDVKAILKLITEILGIHFPSGRLLSSTMGLNKDLEDFLKLVPMKRIEDLVMEYLTSDADFQEAVEYMLSDDFKKLVLEIEGIQDVKLFIKYLNDAGLDVYTVLNKIHDFLGLDHITPAVVNSLDVYATYRITGGLPGLIEDVKAMLPIDKIEALYKEKLKSSPEFAALIKRLSSPEFQKIVNTVWANPKLQELIKRAQDKGVDVKAILQLITEILGIHFPRSMQFNNVRYGENLNDDLNDFMEIIPMNDVLEIALEYVAVDKDFQIFVDYLTSDYFGGLITEIENIKGVSEFLKYLHESGLDVYTFLNKLHAIWNLDPIKPLPHSLKVVKITGGLQGFINDVIAALPVKDIEELYNEKLEESESLQDLLRRIQTPEFQTMVDVLMVNERLNDLMKRVEEKGVDVNAILKAISQLLGIKLPSRPKPSVFRDDALMKDLHDIVKLVPKKKIAKIVMTYAVFDKDFKRVMKYMRSNDFHKLIRDVEATKEMKEFLEYLNNIGLDVYKWIKTLHKIIGMKEKKVLSYFLNPEKISGGISGLIKDIKAALPVKKLRKLYVKKLETSPAFAEFVKRLRSQELQNLINTLANIKEVQRVLTTLETMGVDINGIFKLLSDFFGIKFPPRPFFN